MARRKNVKRIDPRYFLHETVNRGEEELTEAEGRDLKKIKRAHGDLQDAVRAAMYSGLHPAEIRDSIELAFPRRVK